MQDNQPNGKEFSNQHVFTEFEGDHSEKISYTGPLQIFLLKHFHTLHLSLSPFFCLTLIVILVQAPSNSKKKGFFMLLHRILQIYLN